MGPNKRPQERERAAGWRPCSPLEHPPTRAPARFDNRAALVAKKQHEQKEFQNTE
jgi:hypothetical protein